MIVTSSFKIGHRFKKDYPSTSTNFSYPQPILVYYSQKPESILIKERLAPPKKGRK